MVTLACLAWTLVSWLANGNLDGYHDMLENYAWAQPLQLGTHKHPPFFAWVVGLWFMVFPQADGFYRLLSYANVGVGLWGVYVLGRRLGLARLAPLGALLLLWCFPYTTLAGKFNANSQLLSLWPWAAALLLASWQEKGARGLAFSVALGVVSAACMLSKYYSGVFLAGFLLPIFLAKEGRKWLLTSRPYVALAAFGLALAPHVAWIAHHHWVTLGYAMDQGGGQVIWGYVLRFALAPIF
jgi:4-amino-4-deoxy-L-arabinose transferase-like glycosyltransferase